MAVITQTFAGAPTDVLTAKYASVDDIPVELWVTAPKTVLRAAGSTEEGVNLSASVNTGRMEPGLEDGSGVPGNIFVDGFSVVAGRLVHTASGVDCGMAFATYSTTSDKYTVRIDAAVQTATTAVFDAMPSVVDFSFRGAAAFSGDVFYGDLLSAGAVYSGVRPRTDIPTSAYTFVDNIGAGMSSLFIRSDSAISTTVSEAANNQFMGLLYPSGVGKTALNIVPADVAAGILMQGTNIHVVAGGVVRQTVSATGNAPRESQFTLNRIGAAPTDPAANDQMTASVTALVARYTSPYTTYLNIYQEGSYSIDMAGTVFASVNDLDTSASGRWFNNMRISGAVYGAFYPNGPVPPFWTQRVRTTEVV